MHCIVADNIEKVVFEMKFKLPTFITDFGKLVDSPTRRQTDS